MKVGPKLKLQLKKVVTWIQTYSASVRLFPSVPSHVNHQHVLGLEWLLLSGAVGPLANERLLVGSHMIVV